MGPNAYRLPAAINTVDVDRSGFWLASGWRDFLKAPRVSLIYGGAFSLLSFLLSYGLIAVGLGSIVLPLAGGFVLLAPIAVVGLYDVSRRLELGKPASLRHVFAAFRDRIGQLSAMGVVLLIIWFVWVEVAIFLFAIIFNQAPPPLDQFVEGILFTHRGAALLLIGSLLGAILAAAIFVVTAVSIPLIFDRPIDVVTAIGISILAVRANFRAMFGWAAMIAVITACGIASLCIGLAVAMPVLAYATWHCYRDVVGPTRPSAIEPAGFGAGI
jgi:uncharacterized membrane protein